MKGEMKLLGFISKNKLLKEMNALKESGKQKNNGAKYPPQSAEERRANLVSFGYECGHDNFYNALYSKFFRK